jgi:hypothetical protein
MYPTNLPTTTGPLPAKTRKPGLSAFFILPIFLFGGLFFSGCEDPGVVGSTFIDENGNLVTASFPLDEFTPLSDPSYSGELTYMPVGRYRDPVFGEITSIGLIRPELDSITFSAISELDTMRIHFSFAPDVYGDTAATAFFDVYEITEPWRGKELRYGDQVAFNDFNKVGSFEVKQGETAEFEVSTEWRAKYEDFLYGGRADADSAYKYEMPGLAIVPDLTRSQKVLFLNPQDNAVGAGEETATRLVVTDTTGSSLFVQMEDWGVAMTRNAQNVEFLPEEGQIILHNTLEQYIKLDFSLSEERLLTKNLARVELVVYENSDFLEGSLPEGHVRPEALTASLFLIDKGDPDEVIFSSGPLFAAAKGSDNTYRFNLTSYANAFLFDTLATTDYYLALESNTGLLTSTLIYGLSANTVQQPKIVVTAVE